MSPRSTAVAVRGSDAGLGRILARAVAARGGAAPDRRRERRQASRALDDLLGAPVVDRGRIYFAGEYHPIAAQQAMNSSAFRHAAFRYAAGILAAVLGGAAETEIWAAIQRGGTQLRASAPYIEEGDIG
jgi:hypothetical protein